jgi:uncharacterized repeat protein (TIGR03803 family)
MKITKTPLDVAGITIGAAGARSSTTTRTRTNQPGVTPVLLAGYTLVMWLFTPCVRGDITLTTVVFFAGTNGANPWTGVVQGSDSNFYGTTFDGGPAQAGTVFKVTPDGKLTTLHSFTAGNDGDLPACGLARGVDGNLYGTSGFDGAQGHGAVFQITPDGAFSVVGPVPATVSLDSGDDLNCVVQGTNGSLYVTVSALSGYNDYGSIFEMALDGTVKTLYSFTGGGDGDEPSYAGLVQATDGNFYGATSYGGAFQFAFTNVAGASFTVLAITNVLLALSNWTVLG